MSFTIRNAARLAEYVDTNTSIAIPNATDEKRAPSVVGFDSSAGRPNARERAKQINCFFLVTWIGGSAGGHCTVVSSNNESRFGRCKLSLFVPYDLQDKS